MTDYKRRSQEYYDNLEHLNIKKENIFYRQNEKNSLVSSNLDKDETLKKYTDYKNKFRPKIIAKDPSTFCFFGSAKSRYENSIYNILNYYPFDGTQQEAINWLSSSSTLDIALVEKHWPSSVGHINFTDTAKECINFYAGPQKIAGSEYTGKLQRGETALRLDPSKGNTVEFWLKKGAWLGNTGDSEHIFDIGTHPSHITAGADEFRFRISLTLMISGITTPLKYTRHLEKISLPSKQYTQKCLWMVKRLTHSLQMLILLWDPWALKILLWLAVLVTF
jgi:hypothetical protein